MAQTNRRRNDSPRRKTDAAPAAVQRPEWLVCGLAAAGMLVAAYLTWLKLTGSGAMFCTAGSGCDLVQASRYGTFLFVPTALWGLAVFVAIGVLGWLGLTATNWMIAFVLASGGVGFSLYLTWLSIFTLGTACPWCLSSLVIMIATHVAVVLRRPSAGGRKASIASPKTLATYGVASAVGAAIAGAFVFAAPISAPPGFQAGLAKHLADTKAVMYGAFWCGACQEQKARFGSAAKDLPYVECDAKGVNARPDLCRQVGVKSFPTWVINGEKREGVMTLNQLADMSRYGRDANHGK